MPRSVRVSRRSSSVLRLAAFVLLFVAGCDRGSTEDDHGEPEQLVLRNHATGAILAIFDGTAWDAALPTMQVGQETAIRTVFLDHDDDEIALGGEYTANAILAQGSPAGVVALAAHGDHIDVEAVGAGTVQVIFQFYHGGHSDWNVPAIPLTVTAP